MKNPNTDTALQGAAQGVLDNWSRGDLAAAVRNLDATLRESRDPATTELEEKGEQYHDRVATFGLQVLRTLEEHEDWGGDTLDAIRDSADYNDLIDEAGGPDGVWFKFERCPVCNGEAIDNDRGPDCPACGEG